MLTRKLNAAVFSALSLTANAATAHHSVVANFDREDVQEVSGTITEVHIRNPHSQYVLEVAGEDGAVVEWFIEWADKNALTRRGVDLDRIKVGDEISVTLWPSHRLENVGYFVQAILADGALIRDCGFLEFRRAVVNSTEYSCDDAKGILR